MPEQYPIYYVGDVVKVLDQVDCETENIATIKLVEQDNEYDSIQWLYLVANEDVLNDKMDPKIPCQFWRLIANLDPYLTLISRATN